MALLKTLAEGKARASIARPNGVAQAKIGLEFQTDAKIYTGKPATPVVLKDYGFKIFEYPGLFHIESDDGELEFVTQPFEEDAQGLSNLLHAVREMKRFADVVVAANEKPEATFELAAENRKLDKIVATYNAGKARQVESKTIYVGGSSSLFGAMEMVASPQASAGVRLEQIPVLYEMLHGDQLIGGEENRYTSAAYTAGQIGKKLQSDSSPMVAGFATLIIGYLRGAAAASPGLKEKGNYPKLAHPLMARNNFLSMFKLMSLTDQQAFREKYDADTLIKIANIDYSRDTPVYSEGYRTDKDDSLAPIFHVPTVAEWLESIVNTQENWAFGKDRLSRLPGQQIGRGMGQLNKMDTIPSSHGSEALRGKAVPVFELRGLQKSRPREQWEEVARRVFLLIHEVNDPGSSLPHTLPEPQVTPEKSTLDEAYKPEYYKGYRDMFKETKIA